MFVQVSNERAYPGRFATSGFASCRLEDASAVEAQQASTHSLALLPQGQQSPDEPHRARREAAAQQAAGLAAAEAVAHVAASGLRRRVQRQVWQRCCDP